MDFLNYILYGMVQFPKWWFDMTSMGLQACVIAPSGYDICIFMVEQVICMIYVDDCILFSKEDKYIDALVDKFFDHNLN